MRSRPRGRLRSFPAVAGIDLASRSSCRPCQHSGWTRGLAGPTASHDSLHRPATLSISDNGSHDARAGSRTRPDTNAGPTPWTTSVSHLAQVATERKPRLSAADCRFGPAARSGPASRRTDTYSDPARSGAAPRRRSNARGDVEPGLRKGLPVLVVLTVAGSALGASTRHCGLVSYSGVSHGLLTQAGTVCLSSVARRLARKHARSIAAQTRASGHRVGDASSRSTKGYDMCLATRRDQGT